MSFPMSTTSHRAASGADDHGLSPLLRGSTRSGGADLAVGRWRSAFSWAAFTRTKPLSVALADTKASDTQSESLTLKRALRWWDLVGYGVGCTVGAGIYSLIGAGVDAAGPAIVLSFVLAGFACLMTSFCYSEFAARVPVAGSAYTFSYCALGEVVAWMIGWDLTLEYSISAAAIARGWASYGVRLVEVFGGELPGWLNDVQFGATTLSPLAAVLVAMCVLLMMLGIKESARLNNIATACNVCVILGVCIGGAFYVDKANWAPFAPNGMAGIVHGASVVFFSYIGYDMVTSLAEETKDPATDVPIGVIGSLTISTGLYCAVAIVITGMTPDVTMDTPLVDAFTFHGLTTASRIVSVGTLLGFLTATYTCLIGQPRIFFCMARDGLFFHLFGKTDSKGTPVIGTVVTGIFVVALALFLDIDVLSQMISIGTLAAFCVVDGSVVVLRYRAPHQTRNTFLLLLAFCACSAGALAWATYEDTLWPGLVMGVCALVCVAALARQEQMSVPETFKAPLVPWVPCAGIALNIYMMVSLPWDAWVRMACWLVVGMCIYVFYGIHNSRLRREEPATSKSVEVSAAF